MDRTTITECVEEATAYHAGPTPAVNDVTRAMRRLRFEQLEEVHRVVDAASYFTAGFRTATDWLATTTRESIGQCKVTLALALGVQRMPTIKQAFGRGELSESALRLLTHAWHHDIAEAFQRDEQLLLSWATRLPHRDFSMVLETWRLHADPEHHERSAEQRYDERSVHLSSMLDGMGRLDGMLDPEGFAIVREAIRAFSHPTNDDRRSPGQRRSDGLVTMAKIALDHVEPAVNSKRRRPRVVATIDYRDLATATGGGTVDTNHDRIVVPSQTIRRMACDANIHRYVADPLGTVMDHGRARRTVSDTQFDRLVIRDHGCRVAGCGIPASGCEAHHARHWLDGGATADDNLILLCWHHHHWLHEQHWSIEPLGAGHFTLHDSSGTEHTLRPPLVGTTLPAAIPA